MKATYMDHFGSSKFKVTGFLKKEFISLDKKEASTFIDGARLKKVHTLLFQFFIVNETRIRNSLFGVVVVDFVVD